MKVLFWKRSVSAPETRATQITTHICRLIGQPFHLNTASCTTALPMRAAVATKMSVNTYTPTNARTGRKSTNCFIFHG